MYPSPKLIRNAAFVVVVSILVSNFSACAAFKQQKDSTSNVRTSANQTDRVATIKLMNEADFEGVINNQQVRLYTLRNNKGMVAQITNFGGRIVNLWVADKDNRMQDVATGYNSWEDYRINRRGYFGALIGRYGNRIAKGKFTLDGVAYQLALNNGKNHLHGGPKGFNNVVWEARQFINQRTEDALELKYISKDGEEGYPGNLSVTVIYTLTHENELRITYAATTDKATPVNLTNHTFFNLHGLSSGTAKDISSHVMQINADFYTPTDGTLIPTGEIAMVKGTPMDFLKPTVISKRINEPFEALKNGIGYDHNWILNKNGDKLSTAAVVYEPTTGIKMTVVTDQPALQFYGGNFFNGKDIGKYGEVYNHRTAFAMEAQHYPDSPNQPAFPNTILRPGETYEHICIYKFEVVP